MRKTIVGAVALGFAFPAAADTPLWSEMALEDVEAAHRLIAENHPGATDAHGDEDFHRRLAEGYESALAAARTAETFQDYRGALAQFTVSFGDAHIWTNSKYLPRTYGWPGFLVELDAAGEYAALPGTGDGAPPTGARLLSCDGLTPAEMEAQNMAPYTTGWDDAGIRSTRSYRMLLNRHDTPYTQFKSCMFATDEGESVQFEMQWQEESRTDVIGYLNEHSQSISRDVGTLEWNDGLWLRLGALSDDVRTLVDGYVAEPETLLSMPHLVVDLRGNGGGNSNPTTELAKILFGSSAYDAWAKSTGHGEGRSYWRASPANLETLHYYRERFGTTEQLRTYYTREIEAMEQALANGEELSAPEAIGPTASELDQGRFWPVPAKTPQVYLITDEYCFSSCLIAAYELRGLGAIHLGATTSSNTHYSEVREIDLPSGLSTFSTLQGVMGAMPMRMGPFVPEIKIPNEVLRDDDAIRAAVSQMVEHQGL